MTDKAPVMLPHPFFIPERPLPWCWQTELHELISADDDLADAEAADRQAEHAPAWSDRVWLADTEQWTRTDATGGKERPA